MQSSMGLSRGSPTGMVDSLGRLLGGFLVSLFCATLANAEPAGQITHLAGILSVIHADGSSKTLAVKSNVEQGDLLTTEKDTYARVKFVDGAEIVMRPGTQLKVESYSFNPAKPETDNMLVSMFKGGLRAVTGLIGKRNHDKVNFSTATATIGIRGTHFGSLLCQGDCANVPTVTGKPPPDGLHLDVADGAIVVRNGSGEVQINAGQFGYVANAHTIPVIVPPQQGIQVTMPSSISQNKSSGGGIGSQGQTECGL
jgi:hypothetical protein